MPSVQTSDLKFRVLAQVVGAQAVKSLQDNIDSISKSTSFLATSFKSLAAAYSVKEAVNFGRELLNVGDAFNKMRQKTGDSVSTLAKLSEQADLADVPMEALNAALKKLAVNSVDAAQGNLDIAGAFKTLGVSVNDGLGGIKTSGALFADLQKSFSKLEDGPVKAALAVKIFGKSGSELIPLLNAQEGAVSKFALALDDDFAQRAETFNDTIRMIGLNLKGNSLVELKTILPTLQEIANVFNDMAAKKSEPTGFLEILGEGARQSAAAFVLLSSAIRDVVDDKVTAIKQVRAGLTFEFKEIAQLEAELQIRKTERARETADALKKLEANSIFSKGSLEEIRQRQKDASASPDQKRGSQANRDELGEVGKLVRETEAKLAKMRAEAQTYGLTNAAKERAILLSELEAKKLDVNSSAYIKLEAAITSTVNARETAKEANQAKEFLENQTREIQLQELQIRNYALSTSELQKLTLARQTENDILKTTEKFTVEGARAYRDSAEAVRDQKSALIDLQAAQQETYSTGAKEALRDYVESARNVAAQVRSAFSSAFANMEDSLVEFCKTGKLNFSKLADDIITDLIRIQVRSAIVGAITGFGQLIAGGASGATSTGGGLTGAQVQVGNTAAKGGVMTQFGMTPLKTYASGGIARSPQLAVFGEGSQAEAYVPLPDNRSIPVTLKGGSGASGGDVYINLTVNADGSSEGSGDASSNAAAVAQNLAQLVQSEIVKQKRPGGLLAG